MISDDIHSTGSTPCNIRLIHDRWFSEIFGHDVFNLLVQKAEAIKHHDIHRTIDAVFKKKPLFIYTKIPVGAVACAKEVEKAGFYLVDTNIVFEKKIVTKTKSHSENIRFAHPDDSEVVGRIAQTSFIYSRFHMDPKISTKTANIIKTQWAMNYFLGKRGDAMVIAEDQERPCGFLQLLFKNQVIIIDLVAVDEKRRKKNIARNMITFAQNQLKGFECIHAGTQVANIPSLRLYESLGFRIAEAFYVFHYHH